MSFRGCTNIVFIIIVLCISCKTKNTDELFELIDPIKSGVMFNNRIEENDSVNVIDFSNIYTGGGVATGDVNNDGLPDLYFSGNMVSSKLYLNKSTKDEIAFLDVTEISGVNTNQWMTGVTMVDINQDGFLDIYACSSGGRNSINKENKLFINQGIKNGIPTFKEQAREFGLNDSSYTTQAVFFDYDRDSDIDMLLIVNYAEMYLSSFVNTPHHWQMKFDSLRSPVLYRNNTIENSISTTQLKPRFENVSIAAGIKEFAYGLGVVVSDINNDGWSDVYISSDFVLNDILYINNKDGTFTNKLNGSFKHTSYAGMGLDAADFNNDGLIDIAVVDMLPEDNVRLKSMLTNPTYFRLRNELFNGYTPQFSRNSLQLNNGKSSNQKMSFSEIGQLAGVHHTDWSWSVLFADFDNDGWKDLFITNGFKRDMQDLDFVKFTKDHYITDKQDLLKIIHGLPAVKVKNYLYQNQGALQFSNVTDQWGVGQHSISSGATYADLDNDGDLDIVVNNIDDYPFIYRNLSDRKKIENHFIKINFIGPLNNLNGIGSKIQIKTKDNIQTYENISTRGFQSCVSTTITVGLGKEKLIDVLTVIWPDGQQEVIHDLGADTTIAVDYEDSRALILIDRPEIQTLLKEVPDKIKYLDREDDYNDFDFQRTMPFKLSQNGPGIAVGDVDGNGTEDFYIGGSTYNPGSIYLQSKVGQFAGSQLDNKLMYEDQGCLFFDADGDSDLDLYIVSGSVEQETKDYYNDRLYVNNGKGEFRLTQNALPVFYTSGSCVSAADFDKDGDLDLFIGGRVVPGMYPLPADSRLLLNASKEKDKPLFIDASVSMIPKLKSIGMVTAALWTDFNNDTWMDLMIVGDGMKILFFENRNGTFGINPIEIENSSGLWNSIASGDFDKDGDLDYVIGNLGLNILMKASKEKPVRIFTKDLDLNGRVDPIVFYDVMEQTVPLHPRDQLMEQVPSLKRHFFSYHDYAALTYETFAKKVNMDDAYVLTYDNYRTSYLENKGKGKFELRSMPIEAQFAPVNGILTADFNEDGILDLLMAGNSNSPNLTLGWCDASIGQMFTGKGDGTFQPVSHQYSGFYVDREARSIVEIISNGKIFELVTRTADSLKVFEHQTKNLKIVSIDQTDVYAEIKFLNGSIERREFYYGSGYLSQTSRHLQLTQDVSAVKIYDFAGKSREIYFESNQ